ncbi:MAG: EI24 domain-containing protein [Pseudomonadota bacterium]
MMMIADVFRAVGQLGDRRFLRVFFLSILGTIVLLMLFLWLWGVAIDFIPDWSFSVWGVDVAFLDEAAGAFAWAVGAFAAIFLMFPVAAVFIGFFLEEIAAAVEARHYPGLPETPSLGFGEILKDGLLFTGALILANLLAFLVYPFAGPFAPFVFLGVNAWLLGRQYFELAAARRIGTGPARALRRTQFAAVWSGGLLMALGLTIPVVNLAIPVLGAAAFTHAYHRAAGTPRRGGADALP